jgi:AcrR family transcriptional regulator
MPRQRADGRREQEKAREDKIMRATITELARYDYGGLSIEEVAARAGVNKTTIYRKWPTKQELVHAALTSLADTFPVAPSAGSLRDDLRRLAQQLVTFIESPEGKSMLRLRLLHDPVPELAEIAKQLNVAKTKELKDLVSAAKARGEIAAGVDITLLLDMLSGVLFVRLVHRSEPVDSATIERIVDMLLAAARKTQAPASRKSPKKRSTTK